MNPSVLLIRHGDVKRAVSSSGEQLVYGPNQPLSDMGNYQLQSLGKKLSETTLPSRIYTSPTLRAVQSASLLQEALPNHPLIIEREGLRAAYTPQWNEQPINELVGAGGDLFAKNPKLPDVEGETVDQAYNRAINEFTTIQKNHPDETVAIITHGEIIGMIQHYLRVGKEGQIGQDATIDKGEALTLKFTPEGKILESRVISSEAPQFPNKER